MLPESLSLIVHEGKGPLNRDELVMDESMKALECAISSELLENVKKAKKQGNLQETEVIRTISELQCALDIIQGAKTKEEKQKVFEILRYSGK